MKMEELHGRGYDMSKQDRQGVRRASELEQKYNLSLLSDIKRGSQGVDFSNVNQTMSQLMARVIALEKATMPKGAIYTTLSTESPVSIFGGTWELIAEGYFVVANTDIESETASLYQGADKCYVWKRIS